MKQIIMSALLAILGIGAIVYRKQLAKNNIEGQNKTFHFHFGKKSLKASESSALIFGIGLIIFAILTIIGRIHWQ